MALALGLVGLIASLSGCGLKKTAITADEFSSKMEDEGYQMVDITNQYEEVEMLNMFHLKMILSMLEFMEHVLVVCL